jgi:hypothetical protein
LANQQENTDLVIQLPWTVPQQENTQAVVFQQPNGQKVYLDLNHSTDTTAISSFALSVIIALILGGFATWLAYWYGQKSFKLTEMSFKTVSEDIKQAAETQRNTTEKLIESQENIKRMDIMTERCNAIRLLAAEFISLCEHLMYEAKNLQNNLVGDIPSDYLKELTDKRDLMEINGTRLELYLGRSQLSANILLFKRGLIRDITPGLRRQKHTVELEDWKEEIRIFKQELANYFEEELLKVTNKGE